MMAARRWRHRASPVMYGRDRERMMLRGLLDDAIGGGGSLVLIAGEAGIGKTTLVEDFVQHASEHGAVILSGGCYDLTATPPYGPWSAAIRNYQPHGDEPTVPAWFGNQEALQDIGSQTALFEETRRFFASIAESQPLVIVLEDMHWADLASLEALRYLGRTLGSIPVLLIVTYRDDEITRRHELYHLLPLLVRESHTERIHLNRLDQVDVRSMIANHYDLTDADMDRLVEHVRDRSGGNPFFAEEILRGLEDEQALQPGSEGWTLGRLDLAHVPVLVRQSLDARLARLSPDTLAALQVAAVIGQDVPLDVWQAVSGASDATLTSAVGEASSAHFMRELPSGDGWYFSHALVRETLYEDLISLPRRTWHRMVAETLVTRPDADPDRVADHYLQAHDTKAVVWLIQAAERAAHAYAWRTAAERFEKVLPLLGRDPQHERLRGWVLVYLARLLRFSDYVKSRYYGESARHVAEQTGDRVLAVVALGMVGLVECFTGHVEHGVRDLAAGVQAGEDLTDDDWLVAYRLQRSLLELCDTESCVPDPPSVEVARLTSEQAGSLVLWLAEVTVRFQEAIDRGEAYATRFEAVDEAILLQHTTPLAGAFWIDTYYGLGTAYAALGRPTEATAAYNRAAGLSRQVGHHRMAALVPECQLRFVHLPYQTDDRGERNRLVGEMVEMITAAAGAAPSAVDSEYAHMWTRYLDGDWPDARDFQEHDMETGRHAGSGWQTVVVGAMARQQGARDQAWRIVNDQLRAGPKTDTTRTAAIHAMQIMRLAVDLALDEADLATARDWLEAHDRWLAKSGAVLGQSEGTLLWARYHHLNSDPQRARERAEHALRQASNPRQPLALLAAHRCLGQLDIAAGQHDEAAGHLQASLQLAGRCEAPYEQALTMLACAGLAARSGDTVEAHQLLQAVREICEPLGAQRALERTDEIESQLPKLGVEHPAGLSPREVEVIRLVAQGMTNAEIGKYLYISQRTVAQHLRSVYNKLGVNSRAAAVARLAEREST